MCTKNFQVYGWKTQTECINWGQVYLYHELIDVAAFKYDLQINNSETCLFKILQLAEKLHLYLG